MLPRAWQKKNMRLVTAGVLVFATLQLCVFLAVGADIFTTYREAQVRMTTHGAGPKFWGTSGCHAHGSGLGEQRGQYHC